MSISRNKLASRTEAPSELFSEARHCIRNPTPFFRFVTQFFAERKIGVLLMMHLISTLVIWGKRLLNLQVIRCTNCLSSSVAVVAISSSAHCGMERYNALLENIEDNDSYSNTKRIVPAVIFGSKFAILFQMALIPLTMCRYSISALSTSVLGRFIPFNKAMQIHAYLGYVMVSLVLFALVTFYGSLCTLDGHEYCVRLSSQIMVTGYIIAGLAFIVGMTSYVRHRLPYEVFYAIHHIVFFLYILTILHTFDNLQRNQDKERCQTYTWVSGTLLYYLCDRSASYIVGYFQIKRASALTICGTQGARMVLLKIHRPTLFDFEPGQYAFLRLRSIDLTWHPFSIASGPSSDHIEFTLKCLTTNHGPAIYGGLRTKIA